MVENLYKKKKLLWAPLACNLLKFFRERLYSKICSNAKFVLTTTLPVKVRWKLPKLHIIWLGFSTHVRCVFLPRCRAIRQDQKMLLGGIGNSRPQTRVYEKVVNSRESFHDYPNMSWNFRLVRCNIIQGLGFFSVIDPSDSGLTRRFTGRNIENSQRFWPEQ